MRPRSLRSYTGKIHFNIYLHEYIFFLLLWREKEGKRDHRASVEVEVGGGGSSEREIVHSGMKNHCVTSGEKYCCFA